ncbi:HesB/IscA family protein [Paenibacillus agilis]|uniref:Iron-sulfur cluster assembly accessory protein n=1 Tax=Paenibacillus agilis TaxID=3020863 RepID=A0A559J0P4_9BACL|nr:iron-sulfur cluster assembly accessory protein [Paenibacillus agilis]TVX93447.1 iron-sulfur cluster assembly accessory protein [Paenibacillus agilis]
MIEISDNAAAQINEMLSSLDWQNVFLRVGVVDGGCSGLSYDLRPDDTKTEDDLTFEEKGVPVIMDAKSAEFLVGLKIDYKVQGMTGGFTMDNPNVRASCGCGASFRTATYRGNVNKC